MMKAKEVHDAITNSLALIKFNKKSISIINNTKSSFKWINWVLFISDEITFQNIAYCRLAMPSIDFSVVYSTIGRSDNPQPRMEDCHVISMIIQHYHLENIYYNRRMNCC